MSNVNFRFAAPLYASAALLLAACASQPPVQPVVYFPDYFYYGDTFVFEEYGYRRYGYAPVEFQLDPHAGVDVALVVVDGHAVARLQAGAKVTAYVPTGTHAFVLQRGGAASAQVAQSDGGGTAGVYAHQQLASNRVAVSAAGGNHFDIGANGLSGRGSGNASLAFNRRNDPGAGVADRRSLDAGAFGNGAVGLPGGLGGGLSGGLGIRR